MEISKHFLACSKLVFTVLTLQGCGGGSDVTSSEVESNITEHALLQESMVLGFWAPDNSAEYSYEFFPAGRDGFLSTPGIGDLKTGRLFNGEKNVSDFYWSIDTKGTILINVTEQNCTARPLSLCGVNEKIKITSSGSNLSGLRWEIFYDSDLNNLYESNETLTYSKKELDLSVINEGSFALVQTNDHFAYENIFGSMNSSEVNLELFFVNRRTPVSFKASYIDSSDYSLSFPTQGTKEIKTTNTFYVNGQGYQDFQVKWRYTSVVLRPSVADTLSVSFEFKTDIQLPNGIDENQLDTSGLLENVKATRDFYVANDYLDVPLPVHGESYYLYVPFIDEEVSAQEGSINEMQFFSDATGRFIISDLNKNRLASEKPFTWKITDNQELEILYHNDIENEDNPDISDWPEQGRILIRFVKPYLGGYKVLGSIKRNTGEYTHFANNYYGEDPVADITDLFPGRFKFDSNDNFTKAFVDFNADGTLALDSTVEVAGGNWFLDENGDLVSYECTDLNDKEIDDYGRCLESFDYITTPERFTNFSHIRKVSVKQRQGNDFLVQYNAIFWGFPFGEPDYHWRIALTYPWKFIGDVEQEE